MKKIEEMVKLDKSDLPTLRKLREQWRIILQHTGRRHVMLSLAARAFNAYYTKLIERIEAK